MTATYTLEGNIAVIQMDDGKANALSPPMIESLVAAITRAEAEAGAMVLVGRPERFCAGFDLKTMMSGPAAAVELLRGGSDLLLRLYAAQVPLVIACTGHALAGGALVVLTGDYRIGASGAFKVGLNEVSIGLPVPVLAMELARDRLSRRALTEATLAARIYDPEGALAAGYLDAVVAPAEVLDRAKTEATRLAVLPRTAFRATKHRLRHATIQLIRDQLDSDFQSILAGK